MAAVTFTLDVEDHGGPLDAPRAPRITRELVEFLAERRVRGTFFVVGTLAEAHPDLVRDIAAAGHELGLHGYRHDPLPRLTPAELRDDLARGKALLEDLTNAPVTGFRAPTFSLVAETAWAADVVAEAGFTYSSSVLPARSPLFGFPGRPRTPFRWPSGLLELPCPVTSFGRVANPYLGGVYFRVLPWRAVEHGLRRALPSEVLWTYCHPYDFDPDEPYSRRPGLGVLQSRLLWVNRRGMHRRVARLLAMGAGAPLAERAALLEPAPTVDERGTDDR
jgi:polysaccharide deacetylase family protein (PEP-CTERM system associated)